MELTGLVARMPTTDELAAVEDRRLQRLVAYWIDRRGGRVVTRRADIDPAGMTWILPYVWLYDVEPETKRLRCRLAGEEIRAAYGMNIVGKYLDEYLLAKNWAVIEAHYRAVIDGPAIGYARGQVYRAALEQLGFGERLGLPLADDDGRRVTMLLGATIYRRLPPTPDPAERREDIRRMLIPLAQGGAAPPPQA